MATEVILPRVDMDMADGKIAHWYVQDGDAVTKGQVLFEIETDKATMEVDAPVAGVMHGIRGELGVTLPVGEVVGWILAPGEAAPDAPGTDRAAPEAASPATSPTIDQATAETGAEASVAAPGTTASPGALLRATPLARSLAREHGIDLRQVTGAGPNGRILGSDVRAALPAAGSTPSGASADHGLNLQWVRRGTGVPLLLIHGFGADQGAWRPLWQQIPENHAVLAIDLPNHGKSALRPVTSFQDIAGLVLQRLDQDGVAEMHLLGHSLGGGVALALAQAAPQRVRSLTLLATAGLGRDINGGFIDELTQADDEASLKAAMLALFHDPARLTGSFVATAFKQLQSPERRAALAAMAQVLTPRGRQAQSLREALDGLQVPAQVIWGHEDRIIPARHALEAPPHVALHLLPAVGHLPQIEAVSLVAALVDHQLRSAAGMNPSP